MEQLPLACDASRDKESRHEPVARFFDEVVLSMPARPSSLRFLSGLCDEQQQGAVGE